MKVGDLVRYVGWDLKKYPNEKEHIGVIISMHNDWSGLDMRYHVQWGNGRIGINLFHKTLELVNESR
jgi:hypothetical protein